MRFDHFDVTQQVKKKYALAVEPVCRKWNLTKNELDVLLFLYNNPEFDRAADIVAHRGMTKSHVSLSASNLEGRGLLTRREDPEDRRAVHLILSEEGRTIAEAGREYQVSFFGAMFEGLSREELLQLQDLMDRIRENIKRMEG
jgi:MarR family transcriptional regulator for hemolysin